MAIAVRPLSAIMLAIALIVPAAFSRPIAATERPDVELRGEYLLRAGSFQFVEFNAALSRLRRDGRVSLLMNSAQPGSNAGRDLIDRVRLGSLDLAVVPVSAVADAVPMFRMFEIPFLIRNPGHMGVVQGKLDQKNQLKARDKLRAAGFESVGWLSGESLSIASRRPLLEPGDLSGLKVARTSSIQFGEPSATELLGRKLGFTPMRSTRTASISELQDGKVDAIEIELSELARRNPEHMFVSITDHLYGGYLVIANTARWAGLSDSVQLSIAREIDETERRIVWAIREANVQARRKLAEQKNVTLIQLPASMRQTWREATRSGALAAQIGNSNVSIVEYTGLGVAEHHGVLLSDDHRVFRTPREVFNANARLDYEYFDDPAVSWNAWFEAGAEVLPNDAPLLEINNVYRFNIDLARYAYHEFFSARLPTTLNNLLGGHGERTLLLYPVLLGDELTAAPGRPLRPQEMTIRLDRARPEASDMEVLDAFDSNQITTPELSQAVNLGGIASWDIKAAKAGCGGIAITVWDQARSIPLDHIVLTVPVRQHEFCGGVGYSKQMTAGLISMLEGPMPDSSARPPDVALHAFETMEGGRKVTHAVLLHRRRLLNSLGSPNAADGGIYAWQLESVLGDYLSKSTQLPALIQEVHRAIASDNNSRYPYEDLAREMALTIFSGKTDYDSDQADRARAALLDAVDGSVDPSVVVRFVSIGGKSSYIPFGLLAAGSTEPIVSKRFTVIQPILEGHAMTSNCVEAWSFARPSDLEGISGETQKLLLDMTDTFPGPSRFKVLSDHPSLVRYLQDKGAGSLQQGEGLIVLAHHTDGYLRYNDTDRPPGRIGKEFIDRKFRPGSVAVLAACTTVGNADETSGIVDKLVSQGVKTLIVSPFAVDAKFGARFAIEFEKQVVRESELRSGASIRSLFEQAVAKVTESFDDQSLRRDMALEFLLVGDPDLKLCK